MSVNRPAPVAESLDSLVLPFGKLGTSELSVTVVVIGIDDDSGIGGGESANGELVLVEVQGAVGISVDDVPVLRGEVVDEVLGLLAHSDVFGDLSSADGEFLSGDDAIVAAAVLEGWSVSAVADRVDGFAEGSRVVAGEVVDVQGLVPPEKDG